MCKRFSLLLFACVFVLVSCKAGPPKEKVYKIKFSHVVAVDTPKGRGAEFFKEEVEKLSKGRIVVSVYPNSQLFRDQEAVTALLMNTVQIICPSTSKLTTMAPEFQVVDLPYLFPTMEKVHSAFDGRFGKLLKELIEKKGFKTLAYWDGAFKQLGSSRHPIREPSDAKGLKFRVMSSKVLGAQFHHIKANPQIMPFSEVYTALEQGVIDGQENTWFNTYSQKFFEVQKYITETNHGYLGYVLLTSKVFWERLPADLQDAVMEAVKRATEYERKVAMEIDLRDRERIIDSGKTRIVLLTPKERKLWTDTFRPMYRQYPEWKELITAAITAK